VNGQGLRLSICFRLCTVHKEVPIDSPKHEPNAACARLHTLPLSPSFTVVRSPCGQFRRTKIELKEARAKLKIQELEMSQVWRYPLHSPAPRSHTPRTTQLALAMAILRPTLYMSPSYAALCIVAMLHVGPVPLAARSKQLPHHRCQGRGNLLAQGG
jgi:hypothetical protein